MDKVLAAFEQFQSLAGNGDHVPRSSRLIGDSLHSCPQQRFPPEKESSSLMMRCKPFRGNRFRYATEVSKSVETLWGSEFSPFTYRYNNESSLIELQI